MANDFKILDEIEEICTFIEKSSLDYHAKEKILETIDFEKDLIKDEIFNKIGLAQYEAHKLKKGK